LLSFPTYLKTDYVLEAQYDVERQGKLGLFFVVAGGQFNRQKY
jgi:hypothetical protein